MRRQDFCIALAGLALLGPPVVRAEEPLARSLIVRADRAWTDTGLEVGEGERLRLDATGSARMARLRLRDWFSGWEADRRTGPQGTYVWPRPNRPHRPLPLAAFAEGPHPAFCLIGRIGTDGAPFFVGAAFDGAAPRTGRLWLGVNDDDVRDNSGHFHVTIRHGGAPLPSEPPAVETGHRAGRPVAGARVILVYVDGLRADVLREMAAAGFLPHFKALFLDQGLAVPNAFSVFPSNTLIANGSLFTGLFSDGTGIKSQNQFERSTLKPRGQLSAWLPDGFIPHPATRVLNLLDKYAPEDTHAFLIKRGVPTVSTRLGKAFRFTTLPIAPLNPPPLWLHRAVNTLGPFGLSTRLPTRLDRVNARYAVEDLLGDPDARLIAVWWPIVDKTCHHSGRGQFGAARRDLALADRYLGAIRSRLRELGWERTTYLILVSDHGHLGGDTGVNRRCNLPRDWAHRQLGWNTKVVGQEWLHPGVAPDRFVFFDNQGAGQAKAFLPYGSYFHGPWRRNRLHELTHYRAGPGRTINLLKSLKAFRPPEPDGAAGDPIDLILLKLDERRVLLCRDEDNQALIHRLVDSTGRETYRYEPIRRVRQGPDGAIAADAAKPGQDPLGYLQDRAFLEAVGDSHWLSAPHTAQEWLEASAATRYPDAVVTMAKFFAWRPALQDLADVRDPDFVVTASPGWSLRSDDGEGTDHGYPLAESMRITLIIAGPNIPHGALARPTRLVDVLPTILEMVGQPYTPAELDGQAITGIYE
jgi:hypothetical protein